MVKFEVDLEPSLANVADLGKSQLQKELGAAVRYSQGTSRASWKHDKAPNWWSEGARIDSHGVEGEMEAFVSPKLLSAEGLRVALAQFYLSRIYFEEHLKDALSPADLEDVAGGKNPFSPEHYAESGEDDGPDPDIEFEDDDVEPEEANSEEEREEGSGGEQEEEHALPGSPQGESVDESHVSERATTTEEPEEEEEEDEEELQEEEGDEKEEEEIDCTVADAESNSDDEEDLQKAETYNVDQLEKFFKKLRKRKLDFRVKKLTDVWEMAMEDDWFVQNTDRRPIRKWMKLVALETAIARAWHNLEVFKRKAREHLRRENESVKMFCRIARLGIPSAPTASSPMLGGTARRPRRAAALASSMRTHRLMVSGTAAKRERVARPGEMLMLTSLNGSPVLPEGGAGEAEGGVMMTPAAGTGDGVTCDVLERILEAEDPRKFVKEILATQRKGGSTIGR